MANLWKGRQGEWLLGVLLQNPSRTGLRQKLGATEPHTTDTAAHHTDESRQPGQARLAWQMPSDAPRGHTPSPSARLLLTTARNTASQSQVLPCPPASPPSGQGGCSLLTHKKMHRWLAEPPGCVCTLPLTLAAADTRAAPPLPGTSLPSPTFPERQNPDQHLSPDTAPGPLC